MCRAELERELESASCGGGATAAGAQHAEEAEEAAELRKELDALTADDAMARPVVEAATPSRIRSVSPTPANE